MSAPTGLVLPPRNLAPLIPGDLSRRGVITALGHSIVSAVGNYPFMADDGFLSWTVHRLNGRLQYVERAGAGGYTTTQIRDTLLPSVLTRTPRPNYCLVMGAINDVTGGAAFATTTANLSTIYATLRGAGITPVVIGDPPNNGSAAQKSTIAKLVDWEARHAREYGYPFVNVYATVVDPATGAMQSAYTADGTHPTPAGAKVIGQLIADEIDNLLPPWSAPLVCTDVDTSNGVVAGCFGSGFTDADTNSLPDASAPKPGLYFQSGDSDVSLTFTDRNGTGDRWLNIERTGNSATTEIRSGGTGSAGFAMTGGGVVALGLRFKLTGMGAGNTVDIRAAKGDSSTSWLVYPAYSWNTDIGDTVFYTEEAVPSGWTHARWSFSITGPAGPTLSIAQLTARDLDTLGTA